MSDPIDPLGFETEDNAHGKFFKIEVPDYDQQGLGSFIRLGAHVASSGKAEELEKVVYKAGPSPLSDHDDPGSDTKQRPFKDAKGNDAPFDDDVRDRGDNDGTGSGGAAATPEWRADESAKLFTKGGWRDHTDGNRVTTTAGDKIEIIGGNYKMVVLGRRRNAQGECDAENAAGWDVSGGHVTDFGNTMPGSGVSQSWTTEYDGTWKLVNEYIGGVIESVEVVDKKEYSYGKKHESYVGSESFDDEDKPSPEIIEKTWAKRIDTLTVAQSDIAEVVLASNLATTTNAVTITEITTAANITSQTDAGHLASSTHAGMIEEAVNALIGINEQVNAGAVTENVNVVGPINSITNAGGVNEQVNCPGVINESVNAGVVTSVTTATSTNELSILGAGAASILAASTVLDAALFGQVTEVLVGGSHVGLAAVGNIMDIKLASEIDLFVGAKIDILLGLKLEVTIPSVKKNAAGKYSFAAPSISLNGCSD
jgi:hypothetical protein